MADKREEILERLKAIAATVPGIISVMRNRGQADQNMRPCIIILDGTETASRTRALPPRRGTGMAPAVMTMQPEIYILLKEGRPVNEEIGTDLNGFRVALVSAIANDVELKTLLGPNGGLSYAGMDTDLKSGGQLAGQMKLDFALDYVFNPN